MRTRTRGQATTFVTLYASSQLELNVTLVEEVLAGVPAKTG